LPDFARDESRYSTRSSTKGEAMSSFQWPLRSLPFQPRSTKLSKPRAAPSAAETKGLAETAAVS
jgi:hypothetical protein